MLVSVNQIKASFAVVLLIVGCRTPASAPGKADVENINDLVIPAERFENQRAKRFKIVNGTPGMARNIMLLDTVNGKTWIACTSGETPAMWCRIPDAPGKAIAEKFELHRFEIFNGTPGMTRNIMLLDTKGGDSWIICGDEKTDNWCPIPMAG